jgi:4-amino-4-deoxy-L-arabinose transferase-like glycosyltransferase
LRVTVAMIGAMGLAVLAVAAATYLMAVNEDDYARITLGVAGVVTALMPVIPWRYLSQLRETIAAGG